MATASSTTTMLSPRSPESASDLFIPFPNLVARVPRAPGEGGWRLSGPESFEYPLRDRPDRQHDRAPEPGQIRDIAPPLNAAKDTFRNPLWAGPEDPFFETGGHRGIDEARLHGEDLHPGLVQAGSQALQVDGKRAFGGAV